MSSKLLDIWNGILDFLIYSAFLCIIASVVYLLMISLTPIKNVWIALIITFGVIAIIIINARAFKKSLVYILTKMSKISIKKMIFIIISIIVVEIICVIVLFVFPTYVFNDTALYVEISEMISSTGFVNIALSYPHLLFTGLFLSIFNLLNISYVTGMFCLFLAACVIYFLAFSKALGKERSFLAVVGYLLMPSSIMWTFSITHEMFYFFFVSVIFYYSFDMFMSKKYIWWKLVIILSMLELSNLINPISVILIISCIIYSIITVRKSMYKVIVAMVIITVIPLGTIISKSASIHYLGYELKNAPFSSNLLVGANYESQGRYNQEILDKVHYIINARGLADNVENYQKVSTELLIEEYKSLLSSPYKFFELIATKFYIAWSGDHYSIEMLSNYGVTFRLNDKLSHLINLMMLGVSACVYLLYICIGITSYRSEPKNSNSINFTKCLVLGVITTLLIIEIMNKYSVHTTILLYMIAVSKIGSKFLQPVDEVAS
ncbi:MAG: hypothetical protein VB122_03460 [Erysipelotrichales bacterium]|nr:hypothetical protein [Erysipelotrichales bacterium]